MEISGVEAGEVGVLDGAEVSGVEVDTVVEVDEATEVSGVELGAEAGVLSLVIIVNVFAFLMASAVQLKVISIGAALFRRIVKPCVVLLVTR